MTTLYINHGSEKLNSLPIPPAFTQQNKVSNSFLLTPRSASLSLSNQFCLLDIGQKKEEFVLQSI